MMTNSDDYIDILNKHLLQASVTDIIDPIGLLDNLVRQKPSVRWRQRIKSIFPRGMVFFASLLKKQYSYSIDAGQRETILLYSQSLNQFDALKPLKIALKIKGFNIVELTSGNIVQSNRLDVKYDGLSFVRKLSFCVMGMRKLNGFRKLRAEQRPEVLEYFDLFLSEYTLIRQILHYFDPKVVIVANDHSIIPRILSIAAADHDSKTVYLQHAAVNKRFPPLAFDYAFLDGEVSSLIYEGNADAPHGRLGAVSKETKIFHIGQMKALPRSNGYKVGIALPLSCQGSDVEDLISKIFTCSKEVLIRPHPGEAEENIRVIIDIINKYKAKNITVHDSKKYDVNDFLTQCFAVVSGPSSILLEASLANCIALDWTSKKSRLYDYYGFIRAGLVEHVETLEEVYAWIEKISLGNKLNNDGAKKHFSASYGTDWQGSEGRLAADILESLVESRFCETENKLFGG